MNYPRVPKKRILLNFVDAALLHFYGEPWRRGNKTNNFVGISASDIFCGKWGCSVVSKKNVSLVDTESNSLPQGRNLVTRVGSGTQPFVGWCLPNKTRSRLESNMGLQSIGMVCDGLQLLFSFGLCFVCVCVCVTVDGWNPAPVDMVNIPLSVGVHTSQVVGNGISAINSMGAIWF